jgi:TctA family transporter
MTRYGFSWLSHPIVVALMILMAVVIAYPYIQQRRQRSREAIHA